MKEFIIAGSLFFSACNLFAQDSTTEAKIRSLEQSEVQAILSRDTVTLKKLWDKDYVVNNPENKIVLAKPNPVDRPVLQNDRTSFTRDVEKIVINNDVAISMGKEIVVTKGDDTKPELTVERRYTNVWTKKDGNWKLIARHANKICK